jgi:hypothetical protein
MPVVFIIARDWTLRANVRAQLRELGIEALGMESREDAGRALAEGQMPSAVVLEATAGIADQDSIRDLIRRVPTVLVASRTETVDLPPVAAVVYRPVRVGEIVGKIRAILAAGHAA